MSAKDIFGRFDTNDDNVIDAQELRDGLLALNLAALPPSEVIVWWKPSTKTETVRLIWESSKPFFRTLRCSTQNPSLSVLL